MDEKHVQPVGSQPAPTPPARPLPGEESPQPYKSISPLVPFLLFNSLAWLDLVAIRVFPAGGSIFTFIGFVLVPLGVISGIFLMMKSKLTYQQLIGGFSALLLTTVGFLEL